MLNTQNKKIFYFILLGFFFMIYPSIYFKLGGKFGVTLGYNRNHVIYAIFISALSALLFWGIHYEIGTTELYDGQFSVTPGKLCRGGPYTWQGNSKRAQMCRNMYNTTEGKEQIDRYKCGSAYTGMPGRGFKYTPLSGPGWENQRCNGQPSDFCDTSRNGIF